MALERRRCDDESLTDIVVTELLDDPPFHKRAIGKVKVNGAEKFFSCHYNVNTVKELSPVIHAAVEEFNNRQKEMK